MQATLGSLSAVTDVGDGSYTAKLTAPTAVGASAISATLNGSALVNEAAVTLVAGPASLTVTTLVARDSVITADSASSTIVTVHVKDAHGNPVTSGAGSVTLQTTSGTLGAVSQATDSAYATLTSSKIAGSATISGKLGGQSLAATAVVRFAAGAVAQFAFSAVGGGAITAQRAGHPFAVRIVAEDADGNLAPQFTGTATISSTGTLFKGAGSTATFTSGVLASQTIAFTDGGTFTLTATSGGAVGTSAPITVGPGVIVYVRETSYPYDTLYQVNTDGTGDGAIPGNTGREYFPSWSRDGSQLVFLSTIDLWKMKADGSGRVDLAHIAGQCACYGTWSPDGSRIAYDEDGVVTSDIWELDADGGNNARWTNIGYLAYPDWSPDGTKIVFFSMNTDSIYSMNPDGTHIRNLAFGGDLPKWSPDGTKIAFRELGDIWVMNPDGSGQTQITHGAGLSGGLSWSPDGGRFAYVANGLWIVNADGSGAHQIVASGAVGGTPPAWRP
jgi:Tol biopolymer transport system component